MNTATLPESLPTLATIEMIADRVMTLRGLLRAIPFSPEKRQCYIDVFERRYGMRGEEPMTSENAGRTWDLTGRQVENILAEIWNAIRAIGSSIETQLDLNNAIERVRELRWSIGQPEPMVFQAHIITDYDILREIESKVGKITTNITGRPRTKSLYEQISLPFEPIIGKDDEETVALNICRSYGLQLDDMMMRGRRNSSEPRLVAQQILDWMLYASLHKELWRIAARWNVCISTIRTSDTEIKQILRGKSTPDAVAIRGFERECKNLLKTSGQWTN